MAFEAWKNKSESFEGDHLWDDFIEEEKRKDKIREGRSDLIDWALGEGYTDNQISTAIEDLFLVMAPALFLYVLVGHPQLITLIQDDVTLTWLDLDAGGITIRQRIINRLS